jgi:predicted RNase H-like HicB family nuclease
VKYAYPVIVEKAGTGFSAYAPDLPGCVATGKDKKQTLEKMKEAMQFHIEGLRLSGLPVPKPGASKDNSKDS